MLKDNHKMQTIKAYLYPNTLEVQILDPSIFTTRNRTVYSRPIKVYQGIDNPVQVIVRNQDQVAVNLTNYSVEAQIQDPINQVTIESYPVLWGDQTKGLGRFTIEKSVIDALEQRIYKITIKLINNDTSTEQPLYIDDNYGVPLDLVVLPAYWSNMAPNPSINESVIDGGAI